jgi:hypothetical protein
MNLARLLQSSALVCLGLLCSCATRDSVRPGLPAEVAFDQMPGTDQRIFLTLHLEDGKELLFIADTGAPGTLLDKSLEPLLGRCLQTAEVNWNALGILTNGNIYAAPKLYLGNTRLLTGDLMCTDDVNRMSPGRPIMGILGMDCLRHYCLQLDLAAHRLRFLDPDQPDIPGQKFPLRLSWSDGKPRLRARFFGSSYATYLMDTGCPEDVDLPPKLFARESQYLPGQASGQTQYSKQMKLSAGVVKHTIVFPEVTFNGEACTNFVLADSPAGNLLGLRFLSRHVATLNFPKRTLTLQPAPAGLFAGDPRKSDEIFQQFTNLARVEDAAAFLEELKKQGELPGWSQDEHGEYRLNWTPDEKSPATDPLSLTFVITRKNDAIQYHCLLVRAAPDGAWKLQRAWRTDAQGRVLKEWPVSDGASPGRAP